MSDDESSDVPPPPPLARVRAYVPAVSARLRWLLLTVLVLFSLLAMNGLYLALVTIVEWATGRGYQNFFYGWMFLAHLVLGVAIIVPFVVFGILHLRNSRNRPNRRAVRAGYGLFGAGLVIVASGLLLMRVEGFIDVRSPSVRGVAYWLHVAVPLVAVWLFVLHRLAGQRIRWRVGIAMGGVAAGFALFMLLMHSQDPKLWNVRGPDSPEYFHPSLIRTATGGFIPAETLMMNDYCLECHADVHRDWSRSVHRFSSFNNPAYLFSVRETRQVLLQRDGNVHGSRFCAGCHDPVPFLSGAFDDPEFDDVSHPTAHAGITCIVCHSIVEVGVRGNADFTIEEPTHYPFATSDNSFLRWVNRQLIRAKPALHKKTFLKPDVHRTAEFCGGCHKVHLPVELNHYRWLRGQNHLDSYRLSGVSGHGIQSFYYPPKAEADCNGCHMPPVDSEDFGARNLDDDPGLEVHDHLFPSANTAVVNLVDHEKADEIVDAHRRFLEGSLRVDIFGVRDGGTIDGTLRAPLRPSVPTLEPGGVYLVEVVLRTLRMGHLFTEGTGDSNEVWVDVTARSGDRVVGRSGGRDADGAVDPWSHFVNAYVLDREGRRIDRRNAQDIFIALYNHQIPPGAADVVHFVLRVPPDVTESISFEAHLRYRKFDTTYMKYIYGPDRVNDLPIVTIASDALTFPVARPGRAAAGTGEIAAPDIPEWQRWNDYGIGLLRKGSKGSKKGELRQAEEAFTRVESLGRPDGPLNLARTYIKEGRLAEAVSALRRADAHDPPAPPWSVAWFTGIVNQENSHLDDAIESFTSVVETRFEDARRRGFDFGEDWDALTRLAQVLYERALRERGDGTEDRRALFLGEARRRLHRALELDPESASAHWLLHLVLQKLGDEEGASRHAELHAKYKVDDQARDRAVSIHRRANPAANFAAESIVLYELARPGAYELPETSVPPKE